MRMGGIISGPFLLICQILPLILFGVVLHRMAASAPFDASYTDFVGPGFWLWLGATGMHTTAWLVLLITAQLAAHADHADRLEAGSSGSVGEPPLGSTRAAGAADYPAGPAGAMPARMPAGAETRRSDVPTSIGVSTGEEAA